MYMKHKPTGDLIEVLDITKLIDPTQAAIKGRFHSGEEMQDPATFRKAELCFPSGETLPLCWVDSHYKE